MYRRGAPLPAASAAGMVNDSALCVAPSFWRELRGSQGMGVVSNSWFDYVLLSILYMFKPSFRPMFKPPSLGPP